jgi:cytochrome c553
MLAILALSAPWPAAGAQIGGRPARPQVERPDGSAWEVIRYNCISCHGIDDYAFFALDRAGWADVIDSRHQGMGVTLSDEQQTLLVDYLVGEFGPDSTPFPRSYIPPEITVFFSDPEAYRLLDRACTSCHDMERIDESRHSLEAWRVILVDMRERGATLSDEELETLAEWLSRVKGINPNQ